MTWNNVYITGLFGKIQLNRKMQAAGSFFTIHRGAGEVYDMGFCSKNIKERQDKCRNV
jgi:hypothetical protein